MNIGFVYLGIAITAEVIATSALKLSEEFTKLWPSLIVVLGYGVAFYFFSLVLKTVTIGVAYAVWSGVGIVLIAVVGALFFKQIPDTPAIIGMGLIVSGVIVMNVFSKTLSH